MLKIGLSKKLARELDIQTTELNDSEMDYYLSSCKLNRKNCKLLIQAGTFYSVISDHKNLEKIISNVSDYSDIDFGIIDDASLRSKVATITAKANSVCKNSDYSLAEITKILNDIPWKFLDFTSPDKLFIKHT